MNEEQVNLLRKRIVMRANRRGCKEGDLILGNFIDKYINDFVVEELYFIEELLAESDLDILEWILFPENVPKKWRHSVLDKINNYAGHLLQPLPNRLKDQ